MKLLGHGWQYSVYDLGSGRVLKKRNPRLRAYWYMFQSSWRTYPEDLWKLPWYYRNADANIASSFQKIRASRIDRKHFGNPSIPDSGFDYEQDYVESAQDYLGRVSEQEALAMIDKFILFAKFLIGERLMDKSFNLGGNFGVNKNGELVLVDIGELYSEPKNIQREINKRVWTQLYVIDSIPKESLRNYFIKAMNDQFPVA